MLASRLLPGRLCAAGNYAQGTQQVLRFLRTGHFRWRWAPLGGAAVIEYQDPLGPPGLDWIGLNCYTRGVVDWKLQSATKDPSEASGVSLFSMKSKMKRARLMV